MKNWLTDDIAAGGRPQYLKLVDGACGGDERQEWRRSVTKADRVERKRSNNYQTPTVTAWSGVSQRNMRPRLQAPPTRSAVALEKKVHVLVPWPALF